MLECLILGDSIAYGIHNLAKECQFLGRVGIASTSWNMVYSMNELTANTVVISLGSNDGSGTDTLGALTEIRNRVQSKKVMWILPANSVSIQNIVRGVATQYNDLVIEIKSLSPDRVHPTMSGYKELAKEIRSH